MNEDAKEVEKLAKQVYKVGKFDDDWDWVDDVDEIKNTCRVLARFILNREQSLRAKLDEARGLIKELEWIGETGYTDDPSCPVCLEEKHPRVKHDPDCRLAKFLAGKV